MTHDVLRGYAEGPEPIYVQAFSSDLSGLSLRTSQRRSGCVGAPIQKQIAKLDPNLVVSDVLTMNQLISKKTANQQLNLLLLSCFAGLVVLWAAIGLYAVRAYSTAQRTPEFGIRLALGATLVPALRTTKIDPAQALRMK